MKNPFRVRMNGNVPNAGFTLIELLTVIAIISILAGLTAVAVPKYLAKAKEVKTISNMDSVAKGLMEYSARTGNSSGYPPAYGFVKNEARDIAVGDLLTDPTQEYMQTEPYTYLIGIHGVDNVYQDLRYATSFDTNRDGILSLFEYLPIGLKNSATGAVEFSLDVYRLPNNMPISGGTFDEVTEQLGEDHPRPYIYVPFNTNQLNAARRYWLDRNPANTRDLYGTGWDAADPAVAGRIFFPPPQYNGFVLIGSGPGGDTGGLDSADPPGTPGTDYDAEYTYHMTALRIAFLATRDLDPDGDGGPEQADGLLDFDFQTRRLGSSQTFPTPDGSNGLGAFIKVVK